MSRHPSPPCPCCGVTAVVSITYWPPDSTLALLAAEGQVVLGGCLVGNDSPRWACTSCRYRFGHLLRDGGHQTAER